MPTDISAGSFQSLFSDAYQWLCRSRKKHPSSSDIWSFRRDWKHLRYRVMDRFIQGRHQFTVQQKVRLAQGDTVALWSSLDALVLKVLTSVVQTVLKPPIELEVKNCLFFQFFLNGNPYLFEDVRFLYVFSRPSASGKWLYTGGHDFSVMEDPQYLSEA